jgi:FSR family fosmidomycin resistance protein-like MFS transporter
MAIFYSATLLFPGNAGLVCLVIAALGSSAFHPVGAVQATLQGRNHMKGRETTATSIFFTAGQTGHFLGPILTGLILVGLGVPGMFILPLVSIPIGLMIANQLHSNRRYPHPSQGQSQRMQAGWLFILALLMVATFQSWAQSNMINLMPKYLKDLGQSATVYGSMAGLFMGGSALGNVIGGYFGDKFPKRFVVACAFLFSALPIYVMSQIGWSLWLYMLVPLAGAATGAVFSNVVVLAQRLIPGGMALASGLALGFIFSSGALGLLYTGPLAETHGFPFVLLLTTGLVLAATPLALMLKEPSPKANLMVAELND